MLSFVFLVYFAALLPSVWACCAASYNVTSLTTMGSILGAGNNTVNFTVHDPDPVTNATSSCAISFLANGTLPTGYSRCAQIGFSWKLGSDGGHAQPFTATDHFGFQILHNYQDDSLGPPPYNRRTVFGSVDVNSTNLDCTTSRVGLKTCSLKAGTVLDVPIWGNA